jgi:hypothetical protein
MVEYPNHTHDEIADTTTLQKIVKVVLEVGTQKN